MRERATGSREALQSRRPGVPICMNRFIGVTLLAAASVVVVAVAISPVATDAKHRKSACYPRNSRTVAEASTGRAFWRQTRDGDGGYFGCLFHEGKQVNLRRFSPQDEDSETRNPEGKPWPALWALHGRYVAFVDEEAIGPGGYTTSLYVVDLRSGRQVRLADTSEDQGDQGYGDQLTSLKLKLNGSAAWIACPRDDLYDDAECERGFEVWRSDSRASPCRGNPDIACGGERLDKGTDVRPRSLRLTRSRKGVTWIRAGRRSSASLR
jgi:hypothetical protein